MVKKKKKAKHFLFQRKGQTIQVAHHICLTLEGWSSTVSTPKPGSGKRVKNTRKKNSLWYLNTTKPSLTEIVSKKAKAWLQRSQNPRTL